MPYDILLPSDAFLIERCNFDKCLTDIYAYHHAVLREIACSGGSGSFAAERVEETSKAAMSFFDWRPCVVDDEGLSRLALNLPRAGQLGLLDVIARHVAAGFVIEFIGEDGVTTRYAFEGGNARRSVGRISYNAAG
jgi:hypothetical protein